MPTIYKFRVRNSKTGKWRLVRYRMTREHARAVYGKKNYELVAGSEFVTGRMSDFSRDQN